MNELSERLRAEFASIEPIYIDGIAGMLNLGVNFATYYFRYGVSVENGTICQNPALVVVRPRTSWPCSGHICKVARFFERPSIVQPVAIELAH